MKNPNKYIRKAYVSLSPIIGVPIYDKEVPKDVNPIPDVYVLISTQTKRQANTTKCGHDWDCTIALDIIAQFTQGYANTAIVDDIEEAISNNVDLVQQDILLTGGFEIYNTTLLGSNDMSLDTKTHTIVRQIVRYGHQVNGQY